MTDQKLTGNRAGATSLTVTRGNRAVGHVMRHGVRVTIRNAGVVMIGLSALSGCINVAAPEEPIVIELNINIRQEVIYRLAEDAANTIDENADIF